MSRSTRRVLEPQCPTDWPAMLEPPPQRPRPVEGRLGHAAQEAFIAYNHALKVPTPELAQVDAAIRAARRYNTYAPPGGRRCVLVVGPSHAGKSHAVLQALLRDYRELLANAPTAPEEYRPWTWTQLEGHGLGRALASAMCAFHEIPHDGRSKSESTAVLLRRFRNLCRPLGLVGACIDDLSSLQGRGHELIEITGVLKAIITSLPITVVCTSLPDSPIVGGPRAPAAAVQIQRRATIIRLRCWPAPQGKAGPWEAMMRHLTTHLALPRGDTQIDLTRHSVNQYLHDRTDGIPGTAISLVKEAAAIAVQHDATLDLDLLRATAAVTLPEPHAASRGSRP